MEQPEPPERYQPLNGRRRLWILLLAVSTAVAIVLTLLDPPGGVKRTRHGPAPCRDGQTTDCVGGKADVILVPPAAPAASAPR